MTLSPPIPEPALILTIGAAGSGKTHIAAAFPRRWRLSLDTCRERVADKAGSQEATPDAVAVYDAVLAGRLARRLTTVVDATNTADPISTQRRYLCSACVPSPST